jgi:hypothetical protein
LRQTYAWLRQYRAGALTRAELLKRMRLVSVSDWCSLCGALFSKANLRDLRRVISTVRPGTHPFLRNFTPLPGVSDIQGFAAWTLGDEE